MEEQVSAGSSAGEKASFGARLGAFLIDAVIMNVAAYAIGMLFGGVAVRSDVSGYGMTYGTIPVLIMFAYLVFMDVKFGWTLGKKALNLRVQNIETGNNLTVVQALLRETVGRFCSGVVFLLGYFWMLWDKDKQTWHDKMAKSVVVKAS